MLWGEWNSLETFLGGHLYSLYLKHEDDTQEAGELCSGLEVPAE